MKKRVQSNNREESERKRRKNDNQQNPGQQDIKQVPVAERNAPPLIAIV
jgi:hypothetical protein